MHQSDFSKVFAKLIELGVKREEHGPFESAPKKSDEAGAPSNTDRYHEADKLQQQNRIKAKL